MNTCTASGIVSRDLARALHLDLQHDRHARAQCVARARSAASRSAGPE